MIHIKREPCPTCKGYGTHDGTPRQTNKECPDCKGTGIKETVEKADKRST